MNKPKTPQPKRETIRQERDFFQTPNYAVDLLMSFINNKHIVWEPAAGSGKISSYLENKYGLTVISSDIESASFKFNFLKDFLETSNATMIITNPPFSLKKEFYFKCKEYKIPFALLIPLDYSQWLINAIRYDGAQKIIPTSRIDYITPSGKSGKNSSSQFHSGWLTWGLELPSSENFITLTSDMKKNI